ncbi:LacI family DNA-binding transcriptional regulator [uncultured Aquimarina sp.]|uniref:LacI family DNA-binding transcriptional regulator n=1 Tax=uncultured Aquimarina sp. TaxID=575652 RepID=UPI00260B771E|nr:LacI family DNA-binding transcriptional regulator [uncultured Aquimarina sp.]
MSKQMMTLKKLSGLSNFSISTVSKALADNPEISVKTRNKIKGLAKLYNYSPNLTAKNLKERKTRTIGVIIPNILAHFFAKVLAGIEKEATEQGYHIITCISDESYEKEVKSIEMLANGSVDGFIISISKETFVKENYQHLQSVINKGLPVLMFDRVTNRIDCDKVVINDFESSYNATKKLMRSGCKNIVFVSPIHNTSVGLERVRGYKEAIEEELIYKGKQETLIIEDYKRFSKDFLEFIKHNKVDGVMAADELSGIYTMNLIIGAGFKVPEDIAVIGFTDGILAENSNPPLTTVDQHGTNLGSIAIKKIVNRLNNATETKEYKTTVVETTLIERGSTIFS